MAGKVFVADIKEGEQVEGVFLVDNCLKRLSKNNRAFQKFYLSDKTGHIEAVAWDETMEKNPDCQRVREGNFVDLSGQAAINRYTSKVEIVISRLAVISAAALKTEDFLPTTAKDIKALEKDLSRLMDKVADPHLNRLLNNLFSNKDFYQAFIKAPAAKNYHHAYIGGLLEHSVAVGNLVVLFCQFYEEMDMSLLIAGAILHDVGKIKEFEFERKIDYSTEGRLKGHIVIGNQIVNQAMDAIPDFPEETKLALSHVILSHQGELEYGAAVRPKTKEAVILSILDNVDAKVNGFLEIAKQYGEEAEWTDYQTMFEDYLYLGPRKIDEVLKQLKLVEEE